MSDTEGEPKAEPPSLAQSDYDLDPDVALETEVEAEASTSMVDRVGIAMQGIGALGGVSWLVLVWLNLDRVVNQINQGPDGPDWKTKLLVALSTVSVLLLSALVFAAGAVCRLLADWSSLRLRDRYAAEQVEPEQNPRQ